jgi:hypothetical protein
MFIFAVSLGPSVIGLSLSLVRRVLGLGGSGRSRPQVSRVAETVLRQCCETVQCLLAQYQLLSINCSAHTDLYGSDGLLGSSWL